MDSLQCTKLISKISISMVHHTYMSAGACTAAAFLKVTNINFFYYATNLNIALMIIGVCEV